MSRLRFIVFSSPRSGSTALRETLHRHPGVTCCGEIFGKNRVLGLPRHLLGKNGAEMLDERNADPAGFAARVLSAGKEQVNGFKLLPSQMLTLENASLFRMVLDDHAIRIVFLWRRDLVRRFLSETKFVTAAKLGDAVEEKTIQVSADDVLTDCKRYEDLRQAMKRILVRDRFVEAYYEDLAAGDSATFAGISDLLELSTPLEGLVPENRDWNNRSRVHIANEADILDECQYVI